MGLTNKLGQLSQSIQQDASNNIGIGGAVDASYKLKVTGTTLTTGAATFSSSITSGNHTITGIDATLTLQGTRGTGGTHTIGASGANNTNLSIVASSGMYLTTNGVDRLVINSSGNVGIGTSSPFAILTSVAPAGGAIGLGIVGRSSDNYGLITFRQSDTTTTFLEIGGSPSGGIIFNNYANTFTSFATNGTERMRLTNGGWLQTTGADGSGSFSIKNTALSSNYMMFMGGGATINGVNASYNTAASIMLISRDSGSLRSINAAGTFNASGTDYAEYIYKSTNDIIQKGDICGIDSNGKLTNIFSDSSSFVIKSTNPSYVGGDVWGIEDIVGKMPMDEDYEDKEQYQLDLTEFKAKVELERAKVDRIAFSGQVPCNVLNAQVGDYIIPINENGKISGQAVTNPTFEQYQISVGKVWKIMEDGRAWIAVKIG